MVTIFLESGKELL